MNPTPPGIRQYQYNHPLQSVPGAFTQPGDCRQNRQTDSGKLAPVICREGNNRDRDDASLLDSLDEALRNEETGTSSRGNSPEPFHKERFQLLALQKELRDTQRQVARAQANVSKAYYLIHKKFIAGDRSGLKSSLLAYRKATARFNAVVEQAQQESGHIRNCVFESVGRKIGDGK